MPSDRPDVAPNLIERLLVLRLARERGGSGDLFRGEDDPGVPLEIRAGTTAQRLVLRATIILLAAGRLAGHLGAGH